MSDPTGWISLGGACTTHPWGHGLYVQYEPRKHGDSGNS